MIIDPKEILTEHKGFIWGEINRRLAMDEPWEREEFYNDVAVVVLEARGKDVKHPLAWLKGIVRNKAMDLAGDKIQERENLERKYKEVRIGEDESDVVSIFETTRAKAYAPPGKEHQKQEEIARNTAPDWRADKPRKFSQLDDLGITHLPHSGVLIAQLDGYSLDDIAKMFMLTRPQVKKRLEMCRAELEKRGKKLEKK